VTAALLVVDVQHGFLTGPPAAYQPDRLLEVTCRLQQQAKTAGMPVIHTQFLGEQGHAAEEGTPGADIHPAVGPADYVVVKRSTDAFHETELSDLLHDLRVTKVYVAGCLTELCVDTTCRSAISRGYETTLVADGHTTADVVVAGVGPRQRIMLANFVLARVGTKDRRIAVRRCAEITFPT
jgi:nicotinamidase-related amidase